jgi:hypothetical protein
MAIQANFPAIKPSLLLDFANTKQLDPRITFTRASTASFYNGVTTAKAEENLVLQSQTFENASWTYNAVAVTANTATAPDGTTTADTFAFLDTATARGYQAFVGNGSSYTFSVYVKYIDKQWIYLRLTDSGSTPRYVWFDIQNGTIGTTETGITASITASTNGFYRCVATISTSVSGNFAMVGGVNANTSVSNVGQTGSLYIWGAQLEQRSAVTAYTATTTQAITNYIPALQSAASGVARFDNNPTTGESLGFLIEESRTNLNVYSSDFSNAVWTKVQGSITANIIVAPDGTLTGSKFVESTATTTQHNVYQIGRTIGATSNTASVYLKAGERTAVYFVIYDVSTNAGAYFNLANGTITSTDSGVTSSITSVGNGWYRCVITRTTASTANGGMNVFINSGSTSYTGDGFSGIYIWGAQLEAGAFATSYIPTVASQVTRAADNASMTGTNFSTWFNASEGTLYVDAIADATASGASRFIGITNASGTTQIDIYRNTGSVFGYVFSSGAAQANMSLGSVAAQSSFKATLAYKTNDVAGSSNGAVVVTDTSATIPVVDRMFIGSSSGSFQWSNSPIKKIAYYPLRVTNANLQALTS